MFRVNDMINEDTLIAILNNCLYSKEGEIVFMYFLSPVLHMKLTLFAEESFNINS